MQKLKEMSALPPNPQSAEWALDHVKKTTAWRSPLRNFSEVPKRSEDALKPAGHNGMVFNLEIDWEALTL
jgi:hypothetical protein